MTTLKTRIRELRARYDLTQEELAKKVGVRRETILFIEKGNYNPSLKLAHDIARALETTIDDLFIFEESNIVTTSKGGHATEKSTDRIGDKH
jgi:putative transcriptional regulator